MGEPKPVIKVKSKRRARIARRRTDWWFYGGAGVVLLSATTLVVGGWPSVHAAAHRQADRLVELGRHENGNQAQLRYRLARLLDPSNQAAALLVAGQQLAAGQPKAALITLRPAGQARAVSALRLQAQLELGQLDAAAGSANQLLTQAPTEADTALAAYAYLVADRADLVKPLMAHLSSLEARRRVERAESNNTALAYELYATGLVNASQRVLAAQSVSLARNLLLAKIVATANTPAAHTTARDLYTAALELEPTSQEARQGLIDALTALGNATEAGRHTQLLKQLQIGRP